MVDWLDKFAQSRASKKMTKTANKVIVDRKKFPTAKNDEVVELKNQKYRVVNAEFSDENGEGILLEKIAADLNGTPMTVDMGTSEDFDTPVVDGDSAVKGEGQEYARVDPKIQDPDPRDEEVAKFEQEAVETEKAIETENSIDGTSGATRPNRILQKMFESGVFDTVAPVETPCENCECPDGVCEVEPVAEPIDEVDDVVVDDDTDDIVDLETYDFDEEPVDDIDEAEVDEEETIAEEDEEVDFEKLSQSFKSNNARVGRLGK